MISFNEGDLSVRVLNRMGAVLLTAWCVTACGPAVSPEQWRAGQRLFAGDTPLVARMVGHHDVLPDMATRCSNCHQTQAKVAVPGFAPTLSASSLLTDTARRGGPASHFDAKALCQVLRNGIDPAGVMVNQSMPRYEVTDAQCQSMWVFLVERAP